MDINKIKKVVINLKRRPDRLEKFDREMNYFGWDYEIFEGVDIVGVDGCALSHVNVVENFLKTDDEHIMILEDDCFFMPYAKNQLEKSLKELNNLEWDFFNLGPTLYRPINNYSDNLLDLTNLPPKDNHHHGIYGLACYIINRKFGEEFVKFKLESQKPIDAYLDEDVFHNFKCFAPSTPLTTQRNGFSDNTKNMDNNHYTILYNWNLYCNNKINPSYYNIEFCEGEKDYSEKITIKKNKIIKNNFSPLDINKIKKVVINLKRRPDRLENFDQEMSYIGWDYEIFEAIDKGSYIGCALSHQEILKDFLKTNDDYLMIIEDDCYFMPYSKNQLEKSLKELNDIEWDFFHLGPSINCPVNNFSENLLNLSELPEQEPHHRGIYNTVCYITNRKFAKKVLDWEINNQKAIDQFFYEDIYKILKCYAPPIPIVTQKNGFSDINNTDDNNHYLITYNWNLYTENKISNLYYDIDYCEKEKKYPEKIIKPNNKIFQDTHKLLEVNLPLLDSKSEYSVKFITAIYSNLYGTELGGRPNRHGHYRWSLLSILKMTNADFICYTSYEEFEDLEQFFYEENNISREKLQIVKFNLYDNEFSEIINQYKDVEGIKQGDRCIEIQYMKFIWFLSEDKSYDYYFWIDAGLSHCGLIPNKHLSLSGPHNRGYYESPLFNNLFLNNLIKNTGDKFTIIGKENDRNFWSGTVNPIHFIEYNRSIHIIGGMFGGRKELWDPIIELFRNYVYKISEHDKRLYHEEDIMTLMFRNHPELFYDYYFETWWHEDERMAGTDMAEHVKNNRSFYKILTELNNIYE